MRPSAKQTLWLLLAFLVSALTGTPLHADDDAPEEDPPVDAYVRSVVLTEFTKHLFETQWDRTRSDAWHRRNNVPRWWEPLTDPEYLSMKTSSDPEYVHPYTAINLHYAWSRGYLGAGQVIAFSGELNPGMLTDPEFADRIVGCYRPGEVDCYQDSDDRTQTTVRTALGARNGTDGVGVAPEASAFLISGDARADGVRAAIAANAVALVFDWTLKTAYSSGESVVWDYFNNDYLSNDFYYALDEFQSGSDDGRGGIIIAPVPDNFRYRSELADLPYRLMRDADLREAWIAVTSAAALIDQNSGVLTLGPEGINSQEPICGSLNAEWCLVGGSGRTSRSAARVAGASAIIAGRFQNSNSEERAARLFATADNSYIDRGGWPDRRFSGERAFGVDGCATHRYSSRYGHGIIDLYAALQPICHLVLIVGDDLATGTRITLDDAALAGPGHVIAPYGEQLDMIVGLVDGLNGEFFTRLNMLIKRRKLNLRRAARAAARLASVSAAPSFAYVDHAEGDAIGRLHWQQADAASGMTLRFGVGDDIAAGIDGWSGLGMTTGALSLVGEGGYAGFGLDEGPLAGLEFTSFVGSNAWHDGPVYGIDGRVRKSIGPIDASLGVRLIGETGSYFGLHSASDLWTGSETVLSAVHTHLSHSISDRVSLVAAGEFGVGYGGDGAFVHYLAPALYSSAAVGVNVKDTLADDDRLWLTLAQPLRLEHAPVRLTLPSGRTLEGDITHETYFRDMAPDRRQIDLGLSYARPLGDTGIAGFAVTHSFNDEHLAGANATNIEAFLSVTF